MWFSIASFLPDNTDEPGKNLENWSSLIGILVAIVGNVLIALALNFQRYAHVRIHRRRRSRLKSPQQSSKSGSCSPAIHRSESPSNYGTVAYHDNTRLSRSSSDSQAESPLLSHHSSLDSPYTDEEQDGRNGEDNHQFLPHPQGNGPTYLKSPYWWIGQVLITVGETGNFLAYGFAPASIVSPLGVVALIANCVIAPFLFNEVFRPRDFCGVVIAVGGVVTVVLSARQEETKLDPQDIWDAITTVAFEVYMGVTIALIFVLLWASKKYGKKTILIDLGLVGLFGGYTALATKGVSSMLSSTLWRAFTTPLTYILLLVLLVTAILQIRYVNRALQRFGSTQVIPIQFVSFTLCVITGSAVLYRDFERTTAEQAAKFVGGCLLTFFGVFLITSGRPSEDDDLHDDRSETSDDQDALSNEYTFSDTINLAAQEPGHQANGDDHHLITSPSHSKPTSRRSSKTSSTPRLVGRTEPFVAPSAISLPQDTGVPSSRVPLQQQQQQTKPSSTSDLIFFTENGQNDASWLDSLRDRPVNRSRTYPHNLEVDQPPQINTTQLSSSHAPTSSLTPDPYDPRPATPRAHHSASKVHSLRHTALYSPSPLSSTVRAMVKDALQDTLDDSVGGHHATSLRRIRSSIRAGLFWSEDSNGSPAQGLHIYDPHHHGEAAAAAAATTIRTTPDSEIPVLDLETSTTPSTSTVLPSAGKRMRSMSDTIGDLFSRKDKKRKAVATASEREGQRSLLDCEEQETPTEE